MWDSMSDAKAMQLQVDGLRALLVEVFEDCGVELDDDRLSYVTVQMGRETWEKLKAAAEKKLTAPVHIRFQPAAPRADPVIKDSKDFGPLPAFCGGKDLSPDPDPKCKCPPPSDTFYDPEDARLLCRRCGNRATREQTEAKGDCPHDPGRCLGECPCPPEVRPKG